MRPQQIFVWVYLLDYNICKIGFKQLIFIVQIQLVEMLSQLLSISYYAKPSGVNQALDTFQSKLPSLTQSNLIKYNLAQGYSNGETFICCSHLAGHPIGLSDKFMFL